MSVNERRLGEALNAYADGVDVTAAELESKQRQLQERVAQGRRPHRGRMLLAVAAVILLLAVAAAVGSLWLRQPDTTVPADPQGAGLLTGLWQYNDQPGGTLFEIGRDGTLTEHVTTTTLVRGSGEPHHRITDDGQQLVVYSATPQDPQDPQGAQGRTCRSAPILARTTGHLILGRATVNEPGCLDSTGASATLTRLSADTRDLPPPAKGPVVTVTDPVQLDGLWVLQGSSTVFAVDEIGGPAVYLVDRDGDLTPAPDASGRLTVSPEGVIILAEPGCANTILRRAQVQGSGIGQVLTDVVDTDPCNRFPGHLTQVWTRVY